MKIKTVFSDWYYAPTYSNSMAKLPQIVNQLRFLDICDFNESEKVPTDKLYKIHEKRFVDSFLSGQGILANSNGFTWTPQIMNAVLHINGGQLIAADLAFKNGIACNVAQGFHHSNPEAGNGYCTFNGLALVASEYPDKKIFVLDLDEHYGDGTSMFTEKLSNLWNFSICGTEMGGIKSEKALSILDIDMSKDFRRYEKYLNIAFRKILEVKPDLVIYQAGMDQAMNDPLGEMQLTAKQLYRRDKLVFEFLKKNNIPCLFVMAGGYQAFENLIPLHVNTFKSAYEVWNDVPQEQCAEVKNYLRKKKKYGNFEIK